VFESTIPGQFSPPRGVTSSRRRLREERSDRTSTLLEALARCADPAERDALVNEIVEINRGVAESVAARYRNRGVAFEDLCQVAYVGLIRAVRQYDAERADDLLTYAVPTIRGEVQRYFRDHGWAVRPPRRVQELQIQLRRQHTELAQELGREPTVEEVCSTLDVTARDYEEAMSAVGCFHPVSLDQPVRTDSTATIGEAIPVEQSVDAVEARAVLQPVLRTLSPRDRRIVHLRFVEDLTQEQIGDEIGVTQMQVSRLLSRILDEMRQQIDPSLDRAS